MLPEKQYRSGRMEKQNHSYNCSESWLHYGASQSKNYYHDGGGSGSKEWCVYASPNVECKAELSAEIETKKCPALPDFVHMPSCRGYWEEKGHVYLVDPWGLTGNFEYYCHVEEQWDYESENKIWEIGMPYDR